MFNHTFDVNIATKYGVNLAIVLNHIAFWIQKNQANEKHFHDGRYWTYNSIKAFQEIFPYWTFKQMRTILDKLKESGLVMTGNYNQSGYDHTTWYALSDEGLKMFNLLPEPEPVDNNPPICPSGQIEKPGWANQFLQKGKPIPDIKPDNKTYIPCASDDARATKTDFETFWKLYPKKKALEAARKAWKKIKQSEVPVLMDKLKAQVEKDSQWQDIQYVPLPSTWLNGKRWEDEIIPEAPKIKTNIVNAPYYGQQTSSTVPFYVPPAESKALSEAQREAGKDYIKQIMGKLK